MSRAIREAGGAVYAISSEPQSLADRAQEEWGLDFECVGDPHHEISGTCSERGWLELFVQRETKWLDDTVDWDVKHPKGFFQPGVLALDARGRVLYRWRSTPSKQNLGGAAQRPTAEHVWERVRAARAQGAPDAPLDDAPVTEGRPPHPALFVALLLANGWFLYPEPFANRGHGDRPYRRIAWAAARLAVFVAGWVWAFAALPAVWVGAALAAWALLVAPGVRGLLRILEPQPDPPEPDVA